VNNKEEPLLSVCIITYNQVNYIRQAIEGVLIQKVNFIWELIIADDFSTDGTREIVLEYKKKFPDFIKLILQKENVGATISFLDLISNPQSKYIAYFEGDDYWTDPLKLQKQVDYLEDNPDYGLVHGDVNHLNDITGEITKAFNKTNNIKIPNGNIFEFLMKPSHSIKSNTTCFRGDLFKKYYFSNNEIMQSDWALMDISIWLMLAYYSKVHYFDEVFATYRLLPESASRTKNPQKLYQFHQKIHAIRSYFVNNYGCTVETRVMIETNKYKSILFDAYGMNDIVLAKSAMAQLKKNNAKIDLKLRVFYLALKFPIIKYIIDLLK